MQRVKAMFDDDSAVSPVIGVILMVAITVILAAVIASFVLGLGQGNEPAPSPTIEQEVDGGNENITVSVTGGDSFDADVATVQGSLDGTDFDFELSTVLSGEVQAGDEFTISANNLPATSSPGATGPAGNSPAFSSTSTVDSWEIEIIYNPSDQDATTIYSDES